jgi:hypothetical protein
MNIKDPCFGSMGLTVAVEWLVFFNVGVTLNKKKALE